MGFGPEDDRVTSRSFAANSSGLDFELDHGVKVGRWARDGQTKREKESPGSNART